MGKLSFTILFLILAGAQACRNHTDINHSAAKQQGIVSYARHFTLEKKEGCTLLKIHSPWQGSSEVSMEYYLVKRGQAVPEGIDSSAVIFIPVRKVICMSVTHTAMIGELGEAASIAAVSGSGLVYSEELRKLIAEKSIPDVGYEASLNTELVLKISPDLIFMYGIGSESQSYTSRINELGIKVLFDAEYLETSALAKAEWIKMFGALYCRESRADSIFLDEVVSYEETRKITEGVVNRPKVLLGLPFRDTWYVSPGNSYISSMIDDAGGEYLWRDTHSDVSIPAGLESVYLRGLRADYWLNTGTVTSKAGITAVDPRFADLPCFRNGQLYNNTKRVNSTGGNDYWEKGAVHPHLILKDMALIFHPELFDEEAQLYFYRKLE